MFDPCPLRWPAGWPRNHQPKVSKFAAGSIANAQWQLLRELHRLGASDVVITTNAQLNRDGSIASRQPFIEDTGVAVYFTLNGDDRVMTCDQWRSLQDNLWALAKMTDAMRGIERWGGKQMMHRTFDGMAALPAGGRTWYDILGVAPNATAADIEAAYKRLVKTAHPDAGGDRERFLEIQRAYQEARAA